MHRTRTAAAATCAAAALTAAALTAAPAADAATTGCTLHLGSGRVNITYTMDSGGYSEGNLTIHYTGHLRHPATFTVDRVHDENGTLRGPSGRWAANFLLDWYAGPVDVNTGIATIAMTNRDGSDSCSFAV